MEQEIRAIIDAEAVSAIFVSGSAEYVKDLFENMNIRDPEENAVKFYANMFFYYSVYDGASDKAKIKCQFERMLTKITEEIKGNERAGR